MAKAPGVTLTLVERQLLTEWAHGRDARAQRAKIVLLAAEGLSNKDIAAQIETTTHRVGRWRWRVAQLGVAGIEADADAARAKVIAEIIRQKLDTRPKKGAPEIKLSATERQLLTAWARERDARAQRAKMVLLAADGWENKEIAAQLGTTSHRVGRWRWRVARLGVAGLEANADAARAKVIAEIIRRTLDTKPREGTRWSLRSMAQVMRVSQAMVACVWRAHGIKPWLDGG